MLKSSPRLELVLLVCLLAGFIVGFVLSYTFLERSQIYPRVITGIGMAITTLEIILFTTTTFLGKKAENPTAGHELKAFLQDVKSITPYVIWILLYFLFIWLIGLIIGSGIFVALFLFFVAKVKWYNSLLSLVATLALVFLIYDLLNLALPNALYDPFLEYRSILRLPF